MSAVHTIHHYDPIHIFVDYDSAERGIRRYVRSDYDTGLFSWTPHPDRALIVTPIKDALTTAIDILNSRWDDGTATPELISVVRVMPHRDGSIDFSTAAIVRNINDH